MDYKKELRILFWIVVFFLFAYHIPLETENFREAVIASLDLARWYAREHVVFCLIPAFFIAGVIAVFINQGAIIKYFGANARKYISYSIASVSGTILAVCSCTVLPLFSSIHKRGAGLGPAMAFLYSGPAINILAIVLTARVLGWEIGLARVIGAVIFAVVIGLIMHIIYRKEEKQKAEEQFDKGAPPESRPIWQTAIHFFILVMILIFATWGEPEGSGTNGLLYFIWLNKWKITALMGVFFVYSLINILNINWEWVALASVPVIISSWFTSDPHIPFILGVAGLVVVTFLHGGENKEWTLSAWDFAKQILPLLALGVVIAGFLFGSTHDNVQISGIIPDVWISDYVGGNSILANFFASFIGAFMYFATLTEIPILQGLIASGMGKGPALALLLAGPSLSLPNILVIRNVIGTEKTIVYAILVIVMATICGLIFGAIAL